MFLGTFCILAICYVILFFLGIFLKDNSIVDIFWGLGFLIISCIGFYLSGKEAHHLVVLFLVFIWALRISLHILKRKLQSGKEDPRYAAWRNEWSPRWYFLVRSFLQIYFLQMMLLLLVALPLFALFQSQWNQDYESLLYIGVFLSLSGFFIEATSDKQLHNFIKNKKPGEIFMNGLYKYSRHPNYFGESLFWFGISCIVLPYSYLALIGWITITFLLLFVSGVPLLEKRYQGNENWEAYKKRTNIFIPWFPKK